MIPVETVAIYVVQTSSDPISNLKLQKLLYYVQGWSLGLTSKPLFSADIQAWIHGPVVPKIFQMYRHFKWSPISKPADQVTMGSFERRHIKDVLHAYGRFSAGQLELLSHKESPWLDARRGIPWNQPSNAVISEESMRKFFGKLANG